MTELIIRQNKLARSISTAPTIEDKRCLARLLLADLKAMLGGRRK